MYTNSMTFTGLKSSLENHLQNQGASQYCMCSTTDISWLSMCCKVFISLSEDMLDQIFEVAQGY